MLVEQVLAKAGGKLMTPSDTLTVFTFVRRLLGMLASKQVDPQYCNLLVIPDQLDGSIAGQPFPDQSERMFRYEMRAVHCESLPSSLPRRRL